MFKKHLWLFLNWDSDRLRVEIGEYWHCSGFYTKKSFLQRTTRFPWTDRFLWWFKGMTINRNLSYWKERRGS